MSKSKILFFAAAFIFLFAAVGNCESEKLQISQNFEIFHSVQAKSIFMGWSANPESDISGYNLSCSDGTVTEKFFTPDTVFSGSINFQNADTLFFWVQAVDNSGNESNPSDTLFVVVSALFLDANFDGIINAADMNALIRNWKEKYNSKTYGRLER